MEWASYFLEGGEGALCCWGEWVVEMSAGKQGGKIGGHDHGFCLCL